MKRAIICLLLTMGMVCAAHSATLTVVNKSKTTIYHLYLNYSSDKNWGDDQLGDNEDDVIEPGDSFELTDIDHGRYDVKLVTDDDTECEVDNVNFKHSKEWVITEHMLNHCDE